MPQTTCVVPECSNPGNHIFPVDKSRKNAWIHAIRRGNSRFERWSPPSKYSYICKDHFCEDDYVKITFHGGKPQNNKLQKTAVPSRFAWTENSPPPAKRARTERFENRSKRKLVLNIPNITEISNCGDGLEDILSFDVESCDIGACVTLDNDDESSNLEELEHGNTDSIPVSVTKDTQSQTQKQPLFSLDYFYFDNQGIHFYTGLENYQKVMFVLYTLGPAAYCLNYGSQETVTCLSVPDQFFLTLMKLRRHYTNFELARMFSISEGSVSLIYSTWICFMAKQWRELNIWPDKELVKYYAPSGFKSAYPSTRVIIDGTECPIKKPKNPRAQQATFSTYKNRNTIKVVVGSTPGGLISYVSPAFGGSTSDRQIVERSSLVSICDPKDSIMADKGFNIQDIFFAPKDVCINIPSFFKNKNRLTSKVILHDRKIASKRVHIERIIGLGKTYRILVEPMCASETKLASEIVFVCFMLCNFRNKIVSDDA